MRISFPGNEVRLDRGFSLFELLVVLILMSLAATLVMPSFSRGIRGLELETTGRDLITRMKKARSRAIAGQKVFRIILVTFDGESEEENPRHFYVFADEFEEEISRFYLPEGMTFQLEEAAELREFPVTISFYPNGRSSGADFALAGGGGRQIPISVDPITGFGKVVREDALTTDR